VLEPYLIQQGYLQRTPRGRIATGAAYQHFGVTAPQTGPTANSGVAELGHSQADKTVAASGKQHDAQQHNLMKFLSDLV
jgi:hypothetical protein